MLLRSLLLIDFDIFNTSVSHGSNKTQVYLLRSRNPFVNLSVEHFLLQRSPPESAVLLLYINRPCVVVGRNQNPWLEVNLSRLAQTWHSGWKGHDGRSLLVRRRSGGGTVFHDEGNVNFSVICPPASFDRNRHAEMVVRALKKLGRPGARVNNRHDIVIDRSSADADAATFKVSGSAYKLTRLRALHHGTCLLRSRNLGAISDLLRSPAEPFIKARGVESVRSPVQNVDMDNAAFEDAVVRAFEAMYGPADVRAEVGDEALQLDEVRHGCAELQSTSWIYGQTPRFIFSTHPNHEDPRRRPDLPFDLRIHFEARHGVIERLDISHGASCRPLAVDTSVFEGAFLASIDGWASRLVDAGLKHADTAKFGRWLDSMLSAHTLPWEG